MFITYINSTTSNLLISNLNSFSRSLSPFKEMTHFHLHYLMTMECFRFFFSKIDENNRLFFFWRFIHSTCPITRSFLKFEFIANFLILETAYFGCDAHQNIAVKRILLPTIRWDNFSVGCTKIGTLVYNCNRSNKKDIWFI